jgi:hypothetical protein
MQKAPAACCNTLGRGRLNVITRQLIQITFRDWRGDINHGGTATIISKYRYRLNRPNRPADRQTGAPCPRLTARRIVMRRPPHAERPHLPLRALRCWQQTSCGSDDGHRGADQPWEDYYASRVLGHFSSLGH